MGAVVPIERPTDLVDGFPKTDSGNAERLISFAGKDLRFVRTWGKWLGWTGKCWALDDGAPHRSAKAMARTMMKQAQRIGDPDRRSAAIKYSLKCEGKAVIEAAISLARHELAVAISHESLDADPWLLCCHNGTIDLKTGTLREHRRDDLVTKLAPIDFEPAATCERFERFVSEIMAGDAALVTFQHRFLGYCLTGSVREHLLAFWYGQGGNGKSLLAFILMFVMGPYAGKAPPDLLFGNERGERHPTGLCDLHGLRLVVANEIAHGRAWNESTLKDVTGGDRIKARRMHEDFWEYDPTHKLVVFGNSKPRIGNVDKAIERRLRIVPFAVSFIGREDKDLVQRLKDEGPGVLAWLVRGCLAWQADGIPDVAAIRDATRDYLRDEDTLGQFFAARLVFEPAAKTTRKELREASINWAEDRGERPVSPKTLADALRARGAAERSVKTAAGPRDGWAGVRLATDLERESARGREIVTSEHRENKAVVTGSEVVPDSSISRESHESNRNSVTTSHYPPTDDDERQAIQAEGGAK